ncbi:MAG: nitrophenyl compound nitroreductase subunit ArsF family protein [Methanoregulaceae archaeon]|jgi:hypothetical protein|nr:nitrophenyl compound nitroreductase subunit ArsF family protein [Methanoregulaceae archaeon]
MSVKKISSLPAFLLILLLGVLAAGCATPVESIENPGATLAEVEKVEVYHFHATRQCTSCIVLGEYTEETVNTYFAPELASGRIVFAHVNVDLPENREIVEKYRPTGSSIWIGVYGGDGFHKEEDIKVWYRLGDRDEYMTYLKEVIEKRLAGDLS